MPFGAPRSQPKRDSSASSSARSAALALAVRSSAQPRHSRVQQSITGTKAHHPSTPQSIHALLGYFLEDRDSPTPFPGRDMLVDTHSFEWGAAPPLEKVISSGRELDILLGLPEIYRNSVSVIEPWKNVGINLQGDDELVGMVVVDSEESDIFAPTENGYGKRTPVGDYRIQKRGGKGLITIKCTARNGKLVGIRGVVPDEELMVITRGGTLIRISVGSISSLGRNTQGVRIINLGKDDVVAGMARIPVEDEPDDETAPEGAAVPLEEDGDEVLDEDVSGEDLPEEDGS